MMEKALAIAFEGQPGPVHIDVPIAVAEGESKEVLTNLAVSAGPVMQVPGPHLAAAIEALNSAKKPFVLAGVDAVNEGAGPAITDFCKAHKIPLITTYKGKGLMDEENPLSLGGHGLSPKSDKIVLPLISEADCILLAGYDPIEMRIGWRDIWNDNAKIIEITSTLRTHGMHRVDTTLHGPIEPTLNQLSHVIEMNSPWPNSEPDTARTALHHSFEAPSKWGPGQVFSTLNQCLPDETVITADSGAHRILLSQIWQNKHPHAFLQSTALCTMGCAIPLAAGYKLALPHIPVCAFVGDAGTEMVLGELATIRDMQKPVIICVLVDRSLALIELKQRGSQRKNIGVDFDGTDFVKVANAMGGHGVWIEDAANLEKEAKSALSRNTYTLLACRIERRAYDGTF